jgi:teichuronic acid biosynthesis glycosyltransferase TuaC
MVRYFKNFTEITSAWKKNLFSKPAKPSNSDDINIIYIKYFRPPRGKLLFLEGYFAAKAIKKKVKKLLESGNILLHAQWLFPSGKATELLSKEFRLPYIITLRGDEVNHLKVGSYNYRSAETILKNSIKVASVSQDLFERCKKKNLIINDNKKAITHNFYEVNKFIIKDKKKAQENIGSNDESKILFFAGGLNKRKKVDILIESVYELCRVGCNIKLYIAGSGYEENSLKNLAKEKKIYGRIKFVGNLTTNELIEYYNAADLFCLASKYEGLPNVVVESLLCGTPVIASSVGEIPFLIKEGENGFLAESNSIPSFCNKIKKGLAHNWNRNYLRESMRHLFPENVLNEYKKLYNGFKLTIN